MRRNPSRKVFSHDPVGDEDKPVFKATDSFFHKPAGTLLICLLLFGLTVWTFAPALKTGFQYFDDNAELFINTHMNSGLGWHNLRWALFSLEYSNWYPLTWISHMLDFKLSGKEPWGHHLTNVLLHATNGVLLFLVLKRMTRALWRSLIVAALFALHPLRVESVAWITERKDVLCAFFGLLALMFYVRYAQKQSRDESREPSAEARSSALDPRSSTLDYGLALLFFAFSLMSKSMLVTFPCLLLLLDFWPLNRIRNSEFGIRNFKRLLLEKVPFVLLIVPVGIATYFAQKAGGMFMLHFPLGFRLETALMGYGRYLEKMFWPANFSVLYPYPDFWPVGQLLCAAVVVLGMTAVTVALCRQRPYLLVGWLWYLGTLVPVIGLLPLGAQSMSNRYSYIPMIGILVLLVWAVEDLSKRWRQRAILMTTVVALVLGVCIMRTRAEIAYWKDSETLWTRAVAVTTNNFGAYYCLANSLPVSKSDEAIAELRKSLAIHPDFFDAHLLLGRVLLADGRFSDAIVHFEKAAQLEPQSSWAYHDLAMTYMRMGHASDAIPPLLKAIELEPKQARYMDDLGLLFDSNDLKTDTTSNFLATARSDPAGFDRFLDAVQFGTNHVVLINDMAWYFATNPDLKLRNGKHAIRLAKRACEMTGYKSHSELLALAAAYAEDSRFDDAISTAQLAGSLASAAGKPDLLAEDQALLELFRSHQPYHEPAR
jgi:tetratricopeptide (TPR) repeat protein